MTTLLPLPGDDPRRVQELLRAALDGGPALGLGALLSDPAEQVPDGTAAVITPISHVKYGDSEFTVGEGEPGEVTMALRDTLTGIQRGTFADTHGWMSQLG